jgi:chaperonin GroES
VPEIFRSFSPGLLSESAGKQVFGQSFAGRLNSCKSTSNKSYFCRIPGILKRPGTGSPMSKPNPDDGFRNLIVVGDKVLIKPFSSKAKTKSGLFLPPGYSEKEEVQYGYVVKSGPGIPIPFLPDEDAEPWKPRNEGRIRYIPLQPEPGDVAIFLLKGSVEIVYNDQKYFIVPQYSILLLERDEMS